MRAAHKILQKWLLNPNDVKFKKMGIQYENMLQAMYKLVPVFHAELS